MSLIKRDTCTFSAVINLTGEKNQWIYMMGVMLIRELL